MTRPDEPYYVLYDEDFGLSGLAGKLGAGALAPDEAGGDAQVGEDARSLLGASLPEDEIRTLWLAACRGRFDPGGMESWLRRLSDEHPAPPRKKPGPKKYLSTMPSASTRPVLVEEEMREAVLAEVRAVEQDLVRAAAPPDVVPALRRAVAEAGADLGFRLLLRILKSYGVRVSKERYDRFQALAEPLEYCSSVVQDDLDVDWPPLDPSRRDTVWDFGLSELAGRFAGYWLDHTALDVVEQCARGDDSGQTPGSAAAVLLEDAVRLRESTLSTDTIMQLWLAASDAGFRLDRYSIDVRHWLEQIAGVCRERLRETAPDYRFVLTPPVRADLRDDVLRELRELAPEMAARAVSPTWLPIPGALAVDAVEQTVEQVDPDLGFRLFLRVLGTLSVPLTRERYDRYLALGARFGYGEYHVSTVDYLVGED